MKTLAVFSILYSVKINSIFKSCVPFIFSESEKVKGGWMPPGHQRTNTPEWRLYRVYKSAPCKSENGIGLKVDERLNARDSLRAWLIIT